MTLDLNLIEEAKIAFGKEFGPKITELGHHLAYGIIKDYDRSFAITARV